MKTEFFYSLSEKIKNLLQEACEDKDRSWFSLGKKDAEISLCVPGQVQKPGVGLQLIGYEISSEHEGTFTALSSGEELMLFRSPSRITVSFSLKISGLEIKDSFRYIDRLSSEFFNKRSIEAFVPEGFRAVPELFTRMSSSRAEIGMKKAGMSADKNGYEVLFDYKGLYHSGDPIRSERRVKQRVIEMIEKGEEMS